MNMDTKTKNIPKKIFLKLLDSSMALLPEEKNKLKEIYHLLKIEDQWKIFNILWNEMIQREKSYFEYQDKMLDIALIEQYKHKKNVRKSR